MRPDAVNAGKAGVEAEDQPAETAQSIPPLPGIRIRELRIALVCYGGVSLAIYMHGVTKEIHKLVAASRAFEEDPERDPFARDGRTVTESVYWQALRRRWEHQDESARVHLRVVVDIIAGTSAGGINGIYLAKALAHDASQDRLRDLWLTEGDIARLLEGPRWIPWQLRFANWLSRLGSHLRGTSTPLRGDEMSRQLYAALQTMSEGTTHGTLVPEGSSLDLFVTMTDLRGYRRFIPIRGQVIEDRSHQHVMAFRHDEDAGITQLDGRHDRALAFAARATSSFPGAFPPVSLTGFDGDIRPGPDQADLGNFFAAYRRGLDDPRNSHFIDGGVLDNAPFGHAVDAIVDKPASTEVERWLIYLEPDPADLPGAPPQGIGDTAETPTLGATLFKALSAIPRREPVIGDLVRLRAHNERVSRLSRLIDHYMANLPTTLQEVAQQARDLPALRARDLSALMHEVHDEARASSGQAYWGYRQLKLHRIAGYLAEVSSAAFTYPRESSQASFVRAVMSEWMRLAHTDPLAPETAAFLNKVDVPYRERRVRFLVEGLNGLYPTAGVPRADVDEAKQATYQHLERLQNATAPSRLRARFPGADCGLFGDEPLQDWLRSDAGPTAFVEQNRADLDDLVEGIATYLDNALRDHALGMLEDFLARSEKWHESVATTLLVRFIGFPLWDTLMYPMMAVSDIQQFSPIRVARFSPDDATFLGYDPEKKLAGDELGHFGAFFDRSGRERDYLWGRLDGSEQLLGLISEGTPEQEDLAGAVRAVLAEERPVLSGAGPLIDELCGRLDGQGDGREGGLFSRLLSVFGRGPGR